MINNTFFISQSDDIEQINTKENMFIKISISNCRIAKVKEGKENKRSLIEPD